MRIVHDRNFVRRYASIVYWRGAWLSARATLRGLITGLTLVLILYVMRLNSMFGDGFGLLYIFDFEDIDVPALSAAYDLVLGNNVTLLLIPIATIMFALLNARFEFWRFMAEAQALVATTETADNTSELSPTGQKSTGLGWGASLIAYGVPISALAVWFLIFNAFILEGGPPRIDAIYRTADPDVYVAELSEPVSRYDTLSITLSDPQTGNDLKFFSIHSPESLVCRGRAIAFRARVPDPVHYPDPASVFEGENGGVIFFQQDVSTPIEQSDGPILALAEWLRAKPERYIQMVATVSEKGTSQYLDALAARRVSFLSNKLIALGVNQDQVPQRARYVDAADPECKGDNCLAANRKISVIMIEPVTDPIVIDEFDDAPIMIEPPVIVEDYGGISDLSEHELDAPFTNDQGSLRYSNATLEWSVMTARGGPAVVQEINQFSTGKFDTKTQSDLVEMAPFRVCPG